jgi:hypothetical protein
LIIGLGEGQDLAAEYLNDKPNAKNLSVAVQYAGFQQYFKRKTITMENSASSDYIIIYSCVVQRQFNNDILE